MLINREIQNLRTYYRGMSRTYSPPSKMSLIQVCALDVGADGTIISGSWDKLDHFCWTMLTIVRHECGRIGNVYIHSKVMKAKYGQSWPSRTTNISQVIVRFPI